MCNIDGTQWGELESLLAPGQEVLPVVICDAAD